MAYQQYISDGEPYGIGALLSDPLAIAAAMRGEVVSQFIASRFNKRTVEYPAFAEVVLYLTNSLGRTPTSAEIHIEGLRRGAWSYVSFTEAVLKPVAEFAVLAAAAVAVGAGVSYVAASMSSATIGATSASAPAAASAVSVAPVAQAGAVAASASAPVAVVASAPVVSGLGATLASAGASLATTATTAAGAAIVAAVIPAPKPSQAAPVVRPSEPVSVSPLALVAGLAAVAGAFLLP